MKWAVLVLAAVLAMALGAVPAQARYLHLAQARSAAERWLPNWVRELGAQPGYLTACYRIDTHFVHCGYWTGPLKIDAEWALGWEGVALIHMRSDHTITVHDPAFIHSGSTRKRGV